MARPDPVTGDFPIRWWQRARKRRIAEALRRIYGDGPVTHKTVGQMLRESAVWEAEGCPSLATILRVEAKHRFTDGLR